MGQVKQRVAIELGEDTPSWARNYIRYLYGDIEFTIKEHDPLVTISMPSKKHWTFAWQTAADKTMFILKWS